MKLFNERKEEISAFDLDLTKIEEQTLFEIGKNRILQDKQAILEYAVKSILEDKIKDLDIEDKKGE